MKAFFDKGLVWFRRDLRAHDHAALYHALRSCRQVWCVFVFDQEILDALPRSDRRVDFIHASVQELDGLLRGLAPPESNGQAGLIVLHGAARAAIPALAEALGVQAVFANHDDEPQALMRDAEAQATLQAQGCTWHSFKDHCIFERDELLTQGGTAFSVFTPYKNAWLRKVDAFYLSSYPVQRHAQAMAARPVAYRQPPPRCRRWASPPATWPA